MRTGEGHLSASKRPPAVGPPAAVGSLLPAPCSMLPAPRRSIAPWLHGLARLSRATGGRSSMACGGPAVGLLEPAQAC